MNIEFYFYFALSVVVVFLVFTSFNKVYNHQKRANCIKNFSDYVAILNYHLERAYDLIHKDQILVYSLDGSRVNEEDIDRISENFIRLTIKLIGPTLYGEFVVLYGDDETFLFNIIEYFNTHYEDDAIRKQALENFTSEEEEGS